VLTELGGLDPAFFLYYEDVDLCRRARASGWEVRHEPGIDVVHHHPLHGRPVSAYLRLLTRHALLTYAGHHWPGWQARWLARIVRLEAWGRGLLAGWRGDDETRDWMTRLGRLALDMQQGRHAAARRRLDKAVLRWERSAAQHDSAVDRHPELQPARSAACLSEERAAECATADAADRRR
jgi:hypothetical protein